MTRKQELLILVFAFAVALILIYVFQGYLGVWFGIVAGIAMLAILMGWDLRWYRGADRKWYKRW